MYKTIEVNYDRGQIRKAKKQIKDEGYISSVAISKMIANGDIKIPFTNNTFFTKMKKLVQNSDKFMAIRFVTAGMPKWYYLKKDLKRMVKEVTS